MRILKERDLRFGVRPTGRLTLLLQERVSLVLIAVSVFTRRVSDAMTLPMLREICSHDSSSGSADHR